MWLQIGCGDGQNYLSTYMVKNILDVKMGGVIMSEA
jgi:cyclopropane fatty-acyl-phospholipid synthase-like methyltransferase